MKVLEVFFKSPSAYCVNDYKILCKLADFPLNLANTAKYIMELGLPKIPRGTGLDTVGKYGFEKAKQYRRFT